MSGLWSGPAAPKVDDPGTAGGGEDLAARYEELRAQVAGGGLAAGGLAAALLATGGTAGWMRGWRACVPAQRPGFAVADKHGPVERADVVGVLATMALACTGGM